MDPQERMKMCRMIEKMERQQAESEKLGLRNVSEFCVKNSVERGRGDMKMGNVLVIGNSGVGKSTLINTVLGEERAQTGWGTGGTTNELEIYESEKIPFRVIDTVGFEPSFLKRAKAVNAVRKWSKESVGKEDGGGQINVIWFCIEGTSSKLFPEAIKNLSAATAMWETVPVIVVITKSYSVPERGRNVEMVHNAFAKQKKYSKNLRRIIPVVAAPYVLNDTAYAAPEGLDSLISATNELMPEGIQAAKADISNFVLARKKSISRTIIATATTAGVIVGAVPIPFADGAILSPIEVAEINALAQLYGINRNERSKQFFNSIVEVGTVGAVARTTISGLKAIPGINLAASTINATVAGSFVAAIGSGTSYAFEQVYLGNKTLDDIDWVKKIIESKVSTELIKKVKTAAGIVEEGTDKKTIGKIVTDVFDSTSA